jgi:predicted helicase
MLSNYLNDLQNTINLGDAREESYYTHLASLIRDFSDKNNLKNVDITILPKITEAGNPDFRIWDGRNHITGYIEAKDPSMTNLDKIEESEQLERYRNTFPNLILTNFYEFRLYRDSELIKKVTIGRYLLAIKLKTAPPVENETYFVDLLNIFFSFSLPAIKSAKSLATELAKRTRFLRDEVISIELEEEIKNGKKAITGFYEAFKKYLISSLTKHAFADLYSQTITYGLFAARSRSDNSFNRELAFRFIPDTIGILRDVFRFISLEEPPKPLQIIVDDIAEVLSVTDVKKILQDYYHEGKGNDPVIHFYETFLSVYDPSVRDKRGVYYTPEPVVRYIVCSINHILKTHFNISEGLAGENVTLLDPSAGTLTFPAEAVRLAVKEYSDKYGTGGITKLIRDHILPDFCAFELMMAPYAIGHLKMSLLFEELGYRLSDDERFRLYLTNALEVEETEQIIIPGLSSLSEESRLASIIKKEQPLLVILGNPPYSGHSANKNIWTDKLLKNDIDGINSYYKVDGKPLEEKNPKWLQDDYVKFLRFAQWKIQKAGFGVVGMITNHSWLDNPTFRGMRQSLMKTYNEIYILNLHGNSLKKETCPDGSKDENVFDIRQGTSIALFIKLKGKTTCRVFYNELYGLRETKYGWLNSSDFKINDYKQIHPVCPYYFLIKRSTEKIIDYLNWKAVNEIFPISSVGIVTSRDEFVTDIDKDKLRARIYQFKNINQKDELLAKAFNLKDKSNWTLSDARRKIQQVEDIDACIRPIIYRPFDTRYIFYHDSMVERTRYEVMQHMLKKNLGLTIGRAGQVVGLEYLWNLAFVTDKLVDLNLFYRGGELIFPLFIYKQKTSLKKQLQTMVLFEPDTAYGSAKNRIPNIETTLYNKLYNTYKTEISPEEILYYIYGILYSNIYREKYSEFLKIDFPRIPFTSDYKTFSRMAETGNKLANLHLMKEESIVTLVAKYNGSGDNNRVEKIVYDEVKKIISINPQKYFSNVSSEVWSYHIGGYQVLKKYLDDRAKAQNEIGDEKHYCRMITAITNTIEIQEQIDNIYPEIKELIC